MSLVFSIYIIIFISTIIIIYLVYTILPYPVTLIGLCDLRLQNGCSTPATNVEHSNDSNPQLSPNFSLLFCRKGTVCSMAYQAKHKHPYSSTTLVFSTCVVQQDSCKCNFSPTSLNIPSGGFGLLETSPLCKENFVYTICAYTVCLYQGEGNPTANHFITKMGHCMKGSDHLPLNHL